MRANSSVVLLSEEEHTLDYYDRNATSYTEVTVGIDMSCIYPRFLKFVARGGRILDAGSGSGRDTLALVRRGYRVDAFDASPALCELSTRLTGVRTQCLRFQDFDSPPRYDGIWACASLLHVPLSNLDDAVKRLVRALNSPGALYMSFKYGSGERIALDGRMFVDMDERGMRRLLAAVPEITIEEMWQSTGEGARIGRELWFNVVGLKSALQ